MTTDEVNQYIHEEERQVHDIKIQEQEEALERRRGRHVEKDFDVDFDVIKFEAKLAKSRYSAALANAGVIARQAARLADAKAMAAHIAAKRALMNANKWHNEMVMIAKKSKTIRISPLPEKIIVKKKETTYISKKDGRRHSLLFDHSCSQW